jgi:hypothetical protein
MTWIVGSAPPFGWAVGLSDIRVSFSDGTELDCLRKIYPVGRFIAAGFAGSVAIGFAMIQRLSELLYNPDEKQAWIPPEVANWWQHDAQEVFNSFGDVEKAGGSQLILLGVHPSENAGDVPWARSHLYTFSWPEFEPVVANPNAVVSIGSGASVTHYRELLERIPTDDSLWQLEAGHFGGMTDGLMMTITNTIQEEPTQGISPHMHVCLVSRGQIQIRKNDRRWINRPDLQDFIMPPVATSFDELEQFAVTRGATATGAVC